MGCRVIKGELEAGSGIECAVFYCSTSGVAFGPVMMGADPVAQAEKFIEYLTDDPRKYSAAELIKKYAEFANLWVCECGALRDDDCPHCHDDMPMVDGHHVDDDGEPYKCYRDPEPAAGERFRCAGCKKQDAIKAAKIKRA